MESWARDGRAPSAIVGAPLASIATFALHSAATPTVATQKHENKSPMVQTELCSSHTPSWAQVLKGVSPQVRSSGWANLICLMSL